MAESAPTALKEAMHRFANETRSVEYVIVPAEGLTAGAPDETALQKFFDERKSAFRAPEFRTIIALALTPNALAKPDAISDADARKRYEEIKTTRFGAPERRAVRQMRFATVDEAKAASERIKAGTSFEAVAAERNIAEKDLDMGRLTRREMIDAAVADAAFALEKDAISEPVNGQFGPVLVKVVDVEPENVRPFEEVAAEVKLELARAAAQNAIRDTYNKIEDQRASAKPLGEIAQGLGLAAQTFDGVDAQGRGKDGKPLSGLPEATQVLRRAFASDVGADNEPVPTPDNGYIWFEVTRVDPTRDRTLAEARDEALARFNEEEIARQVADKAAGLAAKAESGETLASIATGAGLAEPKNAAGLKRDAASGDVSRTAAVQLFNAPVGRVLTAPAANGRDRLVLKIIDASVPPFVTTTQDAGRMDESLRQQLSQDLMSNYVSRVQSDLGVRINQEAVRLAVGGETP